jgi:ElaB/YqjD/DUF883 family membrane-anchored ribosome-binding protein
MDIDEQMADSSVQAGLGRAGAVVKDVADKAREKFASYREGGLDQISGDIEDYARRQPATALLIAAGVGLLVGMLLRPGRE